MRYYTNVFPDEKKQVRISPDLTYQIVTTNNAVFRLAPANDQDGDNGLRFVQLWRNLDALDRPLKTWSAVVEDDGKTDTVFEVIEPVIAAGGVLRLLAADTMVVYYVQSVTLIQE